MTATIIFVLAGIYCLARGVMDLRVRRWIWGSLGVISGIGILAAPVPTQVQVTIPAAENAAR